MTLVKLALFVQLEAKPGKEAAVEDCLQGGLPVVEQELATTVSFALRLGRYGIFEAFPDEAGRQAHRTGRIENQSACSLA